MKKNIIILFFSVLTIAACSTSKRSSTTDAAKNKSANKEASEESAALVRGKSIYEQYCGLCHGLKKTDNYNATQWATIVPKMVEKTNKKTGKTAIADAEQQILMKYLLSACKK
jgi:cytochrome c5